MREGFELSLHVVGARFANPKGKGNRQFEILVCKPGEIVILCREPKNKADANAVAVFSARDIQIGYLTAERAAWMSPEIASGRQITAIYQEATPFGAAIRIAFDGTLPTLPPPTPPRRPPRDEVFDPDPDFYPDFIPPDD